MSRFARLLLPLLVITLSACEITPDDLIGLLSIETVDSQSGEPVAASIILDGEPTGRTTPATLEHVELGSHEVLLVADQYDQFSTTVSLSEDESTRELNLALDRWQGTLVVNSSDDSGSPIDGAHILLDGAWFDERLTPDTLSLPVGDYTLSVRLTGYLSDPVSMVVTVVHDQQQELNFALELISEPTGKLVVDSRHDGEPYFGLAIWLDGEPTGQITPDTLMSLIADIDHEIALYSGQCFRTDTTVQLAEDEIQLWQPDVDYHTLSIQTSGTAGQVYLDESPLWQVTPLTLENISGEHFVTVAASGFITELPGGRQVVDPCDQEVEFTLSPLADGIQVGTAARDFRLPQFGTGDSLGLHQFRGRVTLLNFWFVECPACQQELPGIMSVYHDLRDEGFRFLGVDVMPPGEEARLEEYVEQNPGYDFPMLMDRGSVQTQAWQIAATPGNILIDKTGRVRYRQGEITETDLRDFVNELLSE